MRTISRFVKAVLGIAVTCEYDDFVTPLLQTDGGIHDQALGTANAQVRMQEDDGLLLCLRHWLVVVVVIAVLRLWSDLRREGWAGDVSIVPTPKSHRVSRIMRSGFNEHDPEVVIMAHMYRNERKTDWRR